MRWLPLPGSPYRRALFVLAESAILLAAFIGAVVLRLGAASLQPQDYYPLLIPKALLGALVLQVCLYYGDLYEEYTSHARTRLLVRIASALLAGTALLALVFYLLPALRYGRSIVLIYFPLAVFGIFTWRLLCLELQPHAPRDTVLILGTGASAQDLARETLKGAHLDFRVAGFVAEHRSEVGRRLVNPSVIGTLSDLPALVAAEAVDYIVVALEDFRGKLPIAELMRCRMAGVRVEEAATFFERFSGKILTKDLRPSWFVFSDGFRRRRWTENVKRSLELALAFLSLLLASPLMLLLALLVKLGSRGPVFYRQERVGEHGRVFRLYKFRTMQQDAEAETGPVWSMKERDPRVTRLGRVLRKLRLDELPQLWNVFRGEMSFVGPRPERPHFVDKLRSVIPFYDERHSVKPGITGWAQIKFGYGSSIEDAEEKLRYDLYYVKHMSVLFDLQILAHTLKVVAVGRGAR